MVHLFKMYVCSRIWNNFSERTDLFCYIVRNVRNVFVTYLFTREWQNNDQMYLHKKWVSNVVYVPTMLTDLSAWR